MKKSSKKSQKKASKSAKGSLVSPNLKTLLKVGVVTEPTRLTGPELEVIAALTEDEVANLLAVYKKFAALPGAAKNPGWRAFCF